MSDDGRLVETLCAAAVAVASVVSTAEEQRAAAECKRRTRLVISLLRSRQQFGAYELLLSDLRRDDQTNGGSRISGKGRGQRVAEGHEGVGCGRGCALLQKNFEILLLWFR